jgi:5'-AMP-activated protein kinase catalytic alpha subunit
VLEKEKINDQKDVERITREIKILKKVRHPNVIQLYEVISVPLNICRLLKQTKSST